MPRSRRAARRSVETITHEEASRRNLPSAEHQALVRESEASPVQVAYERRNRDLDPQLVWRGKDEQDLADLTVNAPPLYIQERVHPKALVEDLLRRYRLNRGHGSGRRTSTSSPTCSPTSTGCPRRRPGPSSTATTPIGPTGWCWATASR